ncbi:MAG: CotH kinase family protein [Planctomycetes bacterium]|nr:CotH kinase family protein [Planctomycetota bacterium]
MRMCALAAVLASMGIALAGRGEGQTPDFYDPGRVRALYLTFHQVDWWQQLRTNYGTEVDIPADLTVDGKLYPSVGVRFKGHVSYRGNVEKEPFNLSLDAFVKDQRLYGYKTLNLNNGYLDPTFVREVVSFELCRRYLPAPRANLVKLYINNESWGIYVNVQQPNTEFLGEAFGENEGNNFKADGNAALQWAGWNPAAYQFDYPLKSGDPKTAWTALIDLIDKLNNTPAAQLPGELVKALNVDRALWYLALLNVFCNLDSYLGSGDNYYLYQDQAAGLFQIYPWDLNESLGVHNLGLTVTQLEQLSPVHEEANPTRPLMARLMGVPAWRQLYLAHLRTVLAESFQWAAVGPLVARYQDLIRADVLADTKKLYSDAQFTQAVTQNLWLEGRWVPGLKSFLEARAVFLGAHPTVNQVVPTIAQVSHTPAEPKDTDTVWVRATLTAPGGLALAEVVYTGGVSALHDDGQHHDGLASDGIYGASIAPAAIGKTVRYFIRAEATGGGIALDPARAEFVTYGYTVKPLSGTSPVEIHEFLAQNTAGIRDEMGQYEDWIELVNTGTAAVDISGFYLTDKPDKPTKWALPANTVLQPGATLLVWADEDTGDGPYHANFKLAAAGESIQFFDRDGKTLLDVITFGPQSSDISTGRLAGYKSVWATFPVPTPRAANRPAPCGHLEYGPLDPAAAPLVLKASGTPGLGGTVTYEVTGAPASTLGHLGIAIAPLQLPIPSLGALLLNPTGLALLPIRTNAAGTASQKLAIPNVSVLGGQSFYLQAFVMSATTGGLSTAVRTRICP